VQGTTFTTGAPLTTVTAVGAAGTLTWSMPTTGGLSINSSTGAITGTMSTLGTFSLAVSVTDGTNSDSLTLYVTVNQYVTAAPRPTASTGPFVLNSEIYDANGNLFRLRGCNQVHWNDSIQPYYADIGVNGVRTWLDLTQSTSTNAGVVTSLRYAYNEMMIASVGYDLGGIQTSGNTTIAVLQSCVQGWINQAAGLVPLQTGLIINVANEWGSTNSTSWENAYLAVIGNISAISGTTITVSTVSGSNPFANCPFAYISGAGGITSQLVGLSAPGGHSGAWTVTSSVSLSGYTSGGTLNGGAVGALRVFYGCPILIDSGGSGQDRLDIINFGANIYNSDPLKNIIYGWHLYGGTSAANTVPYLNALAAAAQASGYAVGMTEFGPLGTPPSPTQVTPQVAIAAAEQAGIGWAAWAEDDNNLVGATADDASFCFIYKLFSYTANPSGRTQWGKYTGIDPLYGTLANAKAPTVV